MCETCSYLPEKNQVFKELHYRKESDKYDSRMQDRLHVQEEENLEGFHREVFCLDFENGVN